MVLRTKTIEYAFPQNEASLAAATSFAFGAITLNIPETTSRTFRSVMVQVTFGDDDAAATNLTSWLIGVQLAAVAFSDVTVTDPVSNTGEQMGFLFTRDITSYFVTNFGAGASQTCGIRITLGGKITMNHTAKLIITYESEEQQTRVKTVKIPLESQVGALTTSLVQVGTNQVPLLDTFLPESTKTFRNIWFEVSGNASTAGVTTATHNLALDAEGADADNSHDNALASDVWYYRQWVRNSMTTSATHQFMASVSNTAGFTFNHQSILLCVTYEYDHTNSTTILNSIQLPLTSKEGMGGTAAGDQTRLRKQFYIEEPATITLVQSGVYLVYSLGQASQATVNVAGGSQADRAYTSVNGSVCGQGSLIQRIDSGGAQGAGITLARGLNTFDLDVYNTDTADIAYPCTGLLFLNYTSGKASGGDGAHNHTTIWELFHHPDTAGGTVITWSSASLAPIIPETSYWVTDIGFVMQTMTTPATVEKLTLSAAIAAGEKQGDGWETLMVIGSIQTDPELGIYDNYINTNNVFDRYPNEKQDRLDVETARVYRMQNKGGLIWHNLYMMLTYHSITFTKSGTVSGSSGGTVNIGFWRNVGSKQELVDTTSRSGNGAFSITWYDDTETLFAEAKESSTLLGRSDTGTS